MKCPRCGNTAFSERDCGPDSYDDDITYTAYICNKCGLWFDGWVDKWLINEDGSNLDSWREAEDAIEFECRCEVTTERKI